EHVLVAMLAVACDGNPPPFDPTFDGNVIVGDASSMDSGTDADLTDTSTTTPDASVDGGVDDAADAGLEDAGDPCTVPATTTVSATEAVDRLAALAGTVIEVTGTATRTAFGCTDVVCPAEMPCCNTCTATVTIDH